jgi:hypothetical protein
VLAARRDQQPVGLLLFDLDLKPINDRWGTRSGRPGVSGTVCAVRVFRRTDVVARFAGGEFWSSSAVRPRSARRCRASGCASRSVSRRSGGARRARAGDDLRAWQRSGR